MLYSMYVLDYYFRNGGLKNLKSKAFYKENKKEIDKVLEEFKPRAYKIDYEPPYNGEDVNVIKVLGEYIRNYDKPVFANMGFKSFLMSVYKAGYEQLSSLAPKVLPILRTICPICCYEQDCKVHIVNDQLYLNKEYTDEEFNIILLSSLAEAVFNYTKVSKDTYEKVRGILSKYSSMYQLEIQDVKTLHSIAKKQDCKVKDLLKYCNCGYTSAINMINKYGLAFMNYGNMVLIVIGNDAYKLRADDFRFVFENNLLASLYAKKDGLYFSDGETERNLFMYLEMLRMSSGGR